MVYINIFKLDSKLKKRLKKKFTGGYEIQYEPEESFHNPTFTVTIEFTDGSLSFDKLWNELQELGVKLSQEMSDLFNMSRKF